MPRSIVIIATNAGWSDCWQAQWKAAAVASERYYVHVYKQPAPWIDPADLRESQRRNPAARYRRLWWGEWVAGEGDALPEDAITRALTQAGPVTSAEDLGPGWQIVAGLDLGLKRDKSALVILGKHVGYSDEKPVIKKRDWLTQALEDHGYRDEWAESEAEPETITHPGTGRLRLLAATRWEAAKGAEVSIDAIERSIIRAHRRFNFASVFADQWQCALLCERLRSAGIPTSGIDPTGSNLREQAGQLLTVFNEGQIDLYPDEDLLRDLRAARVQEKSYGFRVTSPKDETGHGDTLSGFLLALIAARRLDYCMPAAVSGELVCWP